MSTIRVDKFAPSAGGTEFTIRGIPKVTWNYAQGSRTVRQSENISSVTDNATAVFTLSFTNSFNTIGYQLAVQVRGSSGGNTVAALSMVSGGAHTSSQLSLVSRELDTSFTAFDSAMSSGVISGDLA